MAPFRFLFFLCCSFAAFAAAAQARPLDCLAGLRSALVAGDFSGTLDCHHDRISVKKIGMMRDRTHNYVIYDYQYELGPLCESCARHAGQRILVFEHRRYKGQYKPDWVRITIGKGKLLLWPFTKMGSPQSPTEIKITRQGFPKTIFINNEFINFFR